MVFSTIPRNEPLVVDMSNFDGMGTLLYPIFAEFAGSHDRLAWVASPNAERQLAEIGVNGQTIFPSVEKAAAFVRED